MLLSVARDLFCVNCNQVTSESTFYHVFLFLRYQSLSKPAREKDGQEREIEKGGKKEEGRGRWKKRRQQL